MNCCTAKHDRPSSITASPLRAMHRRFCQKDQPSSPKKMRLELAEALQIDLERWNLPKSGENCAQKTFRGHLDSERVKLTVICTAAIATLPRTSFPDNNFASCLLGVLGCHGRPLMWNSSIVLILVEKCETKASCRRPCFASAWNCSACTVVRCGRTDLIDLFPAAFVSSQIAQVGSPRILERVVPVQVRSAAKSL